MNTLDMPVRDRPNTASEKALSLEEMDGEMTFIIRTEREAMPGLYQFQVSFRPEASLHSAGAAIRLSIRISDLSGHYEQLDIFVDPMQVDSQTVFHRLMTQHKITVRFEDLNGKQLGQMFIPLGQSDRNELARVVMRGIAHDLKLHCVDCRWKSTP